MASIKFTNEHEWVRKEDSEIAVVGITDFAQEQLGDVVHVELPEVNSEIDKGMTISTVDSVKAASDIKSPVSGRIIEVNDQLSDDPSLINQDPLEGGWFYKIQLYDNSELDELMDESEYKKYVEKQN